jgi:hypothetical protein
MSMRKPLAGLVVLAGSALVAGILAAPAAEADPGGYSVPNIPYVPQKYVCTGQDWGGHNLPPVSFMYQSEPTMAVHRAETEWRGKAKYSSIVCTPS